MSVRVWDLPTRLFHWGLVASCVTAFATGESPRWGAVHTASGAICALLVAARIVWGFVGERWSRWSSLGVEPGHDRLASISVVAAMIGVAALAVTGVVVLGGEELRGPLARWLSIEQGVMVHAIHGAIAWVGAGWLVLHLLGVARKSYEHRQNLVSSMIHGRKRWEGEAVAQRSGAAVALVGLASAAVCWAVLGPEREPTLLAQSEHWNEACGECHLAFHPSLMPSGAWERMLTEEEHFGEFLGFDAAMTEQLTSFARANAAEQHQSEHAVRSDAEGSLSGRITETMWWQENHRELASEIFDREDIGGKLRCKACHPDSEQGTFDGRAADIPSPTPARTVSWRLP